MPFSVDAEPSSVKRRKSVEVLSSKLNSSHPPSYLSPELVPLLMVISVSNANNASFSVRLILVSKFVIVGVPNNPEKELGIREGLLIFPTFSSRSQSANKLFDPEKSSEAAMPKFEIEEKRFIKSRPLSPLAILHPYRFI